MKKKILLISILFVIVAAVIYLQFGCPPEIINSSTSASSDYTEEHISVNLNMLFAGDFEHLTVEIIECCRENNFNNFLFSYDVNKPNALYGTVYLNKHSFNSGRELYRFEYKQKYKNGNYNFIDHPEKFSIFIEKHDN